MHYTTTHEILIEMNIIAHHGVSKHNFMSEPCFFLERCCFTPFFMLSAHLLKFYINNDLIIGYPHFIPGCFYTCQGISYTRVLRMREGGGKRIWCLLICYVCLQILPYLPCHTCRAWRRRLVMFSRGSSVSEMTFCLVISCHMVHYLKPLVK
jgi:hypothetical protein